LRTLSVLIASLLTWTRGLSRVPLPGTLLGGPILQGAFLLRAFLLGGSLIDGLLALIHGSARLSGRLHGNLPQGQRARQQYAA
jgi:hypothetical protein